MIDLAQQLARAIESQHPTAYCWGCWAQQLDTEQVVIREAAQQVLIDHPEKFALARRACTGCGQTEALLVFTRGEPSGSSVGKERKRLLIVDDELDLLDILREHFAYRYEVDTADSGSAAMNRFSERRPDAVFLDIAMPGISGVDVLKVLQQTDSTVPIIMVTANADSATAEECLKSGAFSWVPKPVNLVYMDHLAALATERTPPEKPMRSPGPT